MKPSAEHEPRTGRPRLLEIRYTRDPRDSCWELRGGGSGARVALLGWVVDAPSVDAGIPPQAARIIANAACRSHLLTLLHPECCAATAAAWTAVPDGWECRLDPPLLKRILGRRPFPLIATSKPERAEALFHCDAFSWELRGQLVLLSRLDARPPLLTYRDLERLFDSDRINPGDVPLPAEVEGLLLPGVDGDFAELVAFNEPLWTGFPEAMQSACDQAGVSWRRVSEEAFQRTAWVSGGRSD